MPLAALLALSLFAAEPAQAIPAQPAPQAAVASQADTAAANSDQADMADDGDDVPTNAPKGDFQFVAWCYGALDEYLDIYEQVKPDLKAIDKLFGTPVVEAEPYSADIAEDRKALKRFAASLQTAERASLQPVAEQRAAAIQSGRDVWAVARLEPNRRLADAWLFWGLPPRCDRAASRLKARATLLGQAVAIDPPKVDAPASGESTQPPVAAPDATPSAPKP